jgi:hypothetical protein
MKTFKEYLSLTEEWQKAVLRKFGSVKPGYWHSDQKRFISDLKHADNKDTGFTHDRLVGINATVEVKGEVVAGKRDKPLEEGRKEETPLTGPHTHQQIKELVGKTRYDSMIKHPFYKSHVVGGGNSDVAFRHRITHLGDHEVTAYGFNPMFDKNDAGKIEPKKMVRFDTYKHRVTNAHLFLNKGRHKSADPKVDGHIDWNWAKSHRTDEDQ